MALFSSPYLALALLIFNSFDSGDATTAVWDAEYDGGNATTVAWTQSWDGGTANDNH